MNITTIIHSEDEKKLTKLLVNLDGCKIKNDLSIYLHAKNYTPWDNEYIKGRIINYKTYSAFHTFKETKSESINDILSKIKSDKVLIIDDDNENFSFNEWNVNCNTHLLSTIDDLLKLNIDTKYESIKWLISDFITQKTGKVFDGDDSNDYKRYYRKIKSDLFKHRIIHIDGGLGDHVMTYPLLEKIGKDCYICCKYPFAVSHIPSKGFIDWNDDLFGGYKRFVYEYGSFNNSPTIIDAFFGMYGEKRDNSNVLRYTGEITHFNNIYGKKIALICTTAAKIHDIESNKNWVDIRWFKLINKLKDLNYFVIQVGSENDIQIPNTDLKFLGRSIGELAGIIKSSDIWLSVDTFFHHFASSIKPSVGICLTPFYNDHAKHPFVKYVEKDCGKNYFDRRWWLDLQQPERKDCMNLIQIDDVLPLIPSVKSDVKDNKKVGVSYSLFEDTIDIFESYIENTRLFADYIVVVYQNENWFNSPATTNIESKLSILKEKGIIDEYVLYHVKENPLLLVPTAQSFETEKRNIGLKYVRDNRCDYYIHMDGDEFYESDKIKLMVDDLSKNDIDCAIVKVKNYFKNMNYVLSRYDNIEQYHPAIYKVTNNNHVCNFLDSPDYIDFPIHCDLTRIIKIKNHKIYEDFVLHNLSYVREDIIKKINNSSSGVNLNDIEQYNNLYHIFTSFYYYDNNEVTIRNVRYYIEPNSITNLNVKGLIKVRTYLSSANDNCSNWRGYLQYDGFLNGVNIQFSTDFGANFNDDINHDIIIIKRPIMYCLDYIRHLKNSGVKVILDYDDAMPLIITNNPTLDWLESSYLEILKMINECDLLTVSTDRLKYYFSLHTTTDIKVIPNIVNSKNINDRKTDNGEKIILGWYGSSGHISSIEPIKDSIIKILNEFDNVYLNLYSDNPDIYYMLNHEKINFIPYNFNFYEFQNSLGDIDINIAPINENYINLHKSNIRIILAGYKGIPSVATNFAEYKDLGRDNVLLCDDNDDWYRNIKLLITDKDNRKRVGENIRNYVNSNLNYSVWVDFKVKMIKDIVNKK
jgi:hypothetical protein